MASGTTFVAIGVGILFFAILILISSSVSRLNTDESKNEYLCLRTNLNFVLFVFKLLFHIIEFRRCLRQEIKSAGLHVSLPGFTLITFPSVFKSMEFNAISVCYKTFPIIDYYI